MSEKVDVSILQAQFEALKREHDKLQNGGGNGPPGGGDMERRVDALEKAIPDIRDRLVRVEIKLDTIEEALEQTMATKSDLKVLKGDIFTEMHKALNDQTWRFIGFAAGLAVLAFTAAKMVH